MSHKTLLSLVLGVLTGVAMVTSRAAADTLYLVGDVVYSSGSDGTTNAGGGYRYGSNTTDLTDYVQALTPVSPAGASQTQGISFALAPGANTFTFAPAYGLQGTGSVDPGSYAGIDFFFNNTGTSFNPGAGSYPGDLVAFGSTDTPGLSVPASGINVQNFQPGGGTATYDGATSFTIGTQQVTVTAFSIDHTPSGSFTLTVTAVPEPASVFLCGIGAVGLILVARTQIKLKRPWREIFDHSLYVSGKEFIHRFHR